MTESNKNQATFLGTYFDRDSVLKLVKVANIFSWIVLVVYGAQLLNSLLVFILSIVRGYLVGLGITDYVQQVLYVIEQPFRGVVYFVALQAIGKVLLMFMDIEENTRRVTRQNLHD